MSSTARHESKEAKEDQDQYTRSSQADTCISVLFSVGRKISPSSCSDTRALTFRSVRGCLCRFFCLRICRSARADGDSFESVFRRCRMPVVGKDEDGMWGGPNGSSAFQGPSEACERALFLRWERNFDMTMTGGCKACFRAMVMAVDGWNEEEKK